MTAVTMFSKAILLTDPDLSLPRICTHSAIRPGTEPQSLRPSPTIITAKLNKRRKSGNRKSYRPLLESISLVASSLKLLPEPWDYLVRQFVGGGGGKGGGFGPWNRFGGDGEFDGWRRRRRRRMPKWRRLGSLGLLLTAFGVGIWAVLDGQMIIDLSCLPTSLAVVVVAAFGVYFLVRGWKWEIGNLALGFCCGASLVGLGFYNGKPRRINEVFGSGNTLIAAMVKAWKRR